MKSILKLVLASFIGGALAFGAFKYFDKDVVVYESKASEQLHNTGERPAPFSLDFIKASEVATQAVVHISAQNEEYANYQSRGNRDPLEDFFYYNPNKERPQAGTGSGVIISADGYIVTNNHVVGYADIIDVILNDGRKLKAQKIGTDPSTDLALIKVETEGLPFIKYANSEEIRIGQWVVAVGNPFNLNSTVTAGIVSAKGRNLDIIRKGDQSIKAIEEFIQTDAVVNPGNSGGALVDVNGDLIGINTAISSPTGYYAGYSFAIPSNLVKRVVAEIMENGNIQRAYLGVQISVIADGSEVPAGVYVSEFMNNSSAYYAGIKKGDRIVKVDLKPVTSFDDLQEALKFAKVGDVVKISVMRDGKLKQIDVKLRKGI